MYKYFQIIQCTVFGLMITFIYFSLLGQISPQTLLGPNEEEACSLNEVEEAKAIILTLIFGNVFAQFATFFAKQGSTMNRTVFTGFDIPTCCFSPISCLRGHCHFQSHL